MIGRALMDNIRLGGEFAHARRDAGITPGRRQNLGTAGGDELVRVGSPSIVLEVRVQRIVDVEQEALRDFRGPRGGAFRRRSASRTPTAGGGRYADGRW